MIQFLLGILIGVFICAFASVLACGDDGSEIDICHGCPYEDYSAGKKDCMYCHEASDDLG